MRKMITTTTRDAAQARTVTTHALKNHRNAQAFIVKTVTVEPDGTYMIEYQLISYSTIVGIIRYRSRYNTLDIVRIWRGLSRTTGKHLRYFLDDILDEHRSAEIINPETFTKGTSYETEYNGSGSVRIWDEEGMSLVSY